MSDTKYIISISGVKKSGKSTSATIISELIETAHEVAFADKLKLELSIAYDIDLIHFYSQDLKETNFIYPLRTTIEIIAHMLDAFDVYTFNGKLDVRHIYELASVQMKSPRDLMQHWGMFLRSVYGPNVHCNHIDLDSKVTIVSDVRFLNEFKYLDNLEGYKHIPLFIENTEAQNSSDLHISEQEYKKFYKRCIKVDNNTKNIHTLATNLSNILSEILNG